MNTSELRQSLLGDLSDLRAGKLSNTSARARVAIAKAVLDTVKVEIAAATLGKPFESVDLGDEKTPARVRRVA